LSEIQSQSRGSVWEEEGPRVGGGRGEGWEGLSPLPPGKLKLSAGGPSCGSGWRARVRLAMRPPFMGETAGQAGKTRNPLPAGFLVFIILTAVEAD